MSKKRQHKPQNQPKYGITRTAEALGAVTRAHRKQHGVSLDLLSGLGNLSPRFLSEFERGKETAELGKVLKALRTLGLEVVVLPRNIRLEGVLQQFVPQPSSPAQKVGGKHG